MLESQCEMLQHTKLQRFEIVYTTLEALYEIIRTEYACEAQTIQAIIGSNQGE